MTDETRRLLEKLDRNLNDILFDLVEENETLEGQVDELREQVAKLVGNKGEWIEHDIKELRDSGYYRCSVCRKGFKRFDKGIRKSDIPWIDGQPFELHIVDNYCPNCGADMRGE